MLHSDRLNGIEITLVDCIYRIAARTLHELNRQVIIIDGKRSSEQQAKNYAQGRTAPGKIITNAPAGSSPHEFACAVDLWIMSEDGKTIDWNNQDFHAILQEESAANQHIVWGGTFQHLKDYDHLEYKEWRDVRTGMRKIVCHTIDTQLKP